MNKQVLEASLAYGQSHLSEQTGYLHLWPQSHEEEAHLAIPFAGNLLYALVLMETKSADNAQEARERVGQLLHFQSPQGGFPLFLHQFPSCQDRFFAAQLLPIFAKMVQEHPKAVGEELMARILQACQALMAQFLGELKVHTCPPQLLLPFVTACDALGYPHPDLEQQGLERALERKGEDKHALAQMVLAGVNSSRREKDPRWSELERCFWEQYHPDLAAFVGPAHRDLYFDHEPEPGLFDSLAALWTGKIPHRLLRSSPHLLQLAMVRGRPLLAPLPSPRELEGKNWCSKMGRQHTLTVTSQREPVLTHLHHSSHALRIQWGDLHRLHSFVCQAPYADEVIYQLVESGVVIDFLFKDDEAWTEKKWWRDVECSVDLHDALQLTVEGNQATVFQLGESVEVTSGEHKLSFCFESVGGKGRYCGHLHRGNRASQRHKRGEGLYAAFDGQAFVRPVFREGPCTLRLTVHVEN